MQHFKNLFAYETAFLPQVSLGKTLGNSCLSHRHFPLLRRSMVNDRHQVFILINLLSHHSLDDV